MTAHMDMTVSLQGAGWGSSLNGDTAGYIMMEAHCVRVEDSDIVGYIMMEAYCVPVDDSDIVGYIMEAY